MIAAIQASVKSKFSSIFNTSSRITKYRFIFLSTHPFSKQWSPSWCSFLFSASRWSPDSGQSWLVSRGDQLKHTVQRSLKFFETQASSTVQLMNHLENRPSFISKPFPVRVNSLHLSLYCSTRSGSMTLHRCNLRNVERHYLHHGDGHQCRCRGWVAVMRSFNLTEEHASRWLNSSRGQ